MQDKNNKELIEVIKEQLKGFQTSDYKQGAWERYQATYGHKTKERRIAPWYWSAAAAIAIVGSGSWFLLQSDKQPLQQISQKINTSITQVDKDEFKAAEELAIRSAIPMQEVGQGAIPPSPHTLSENLRLQGLARPMYNESTLINMPLAGLSLKNSLAHSIAPSQGKLQTDRHAFDYTNSTALQTIEMGMGFTAAQQQGDLEKQTESQTLSLSPKSFRLMDKLAIGAFLSPSKSDNKIDLGGGLLLAYQLTDKLSLRTGAAFNQYEVGILPSKISVQKNIHDRPSDSPVLSDMPYRVSASLPNINAITGKVQTLDIPLEMEYKLTKSFYTSVGVSYAAVLSQERYNHYQELADPLMFSTSSDAGKPINEEIKVVDKKIASTEDNVETNGFAGFLNLSIGRKTQISKTFKMSIEPYVKFPVGQFKRADMNYTNGGIKIITNF